MTGEIYCEKVELIKERVSSAIVVQQRIGSSTEMGKQAQTRKEGGNDMHRSCVLYRSRSKSKRKIGRSLSKTSSPM